METLLFMLAPLTASLVLVSLHAYTGLHILARGVIFIDLALAQIATLGIALALILDYEPTSAPAYVMAFLFTVIGAAIFASMRRVPQSFVPQQALIGITYVVASAALILMMANSPHGSENLKAFLVGAILWTSWEEIALILAVYLALAVLHWMLRHRFMGLSLARGPQERYDLLWDFLFYILFGVMITFSVRLAGVLLVFSYLLIPGAMSAFLAKRFPQRLLVAWTLGALGSAAGIVVSFQYDFPTGATIVCVYGAMLILTIAWAFAFGPLRAGASRRG